MLEIRKQIRSFDPKIKEQVDLLAEDIGELKANVQQNLGVSDNSEQQKINLQASLINPNSANLQKFKIDRQVLELMKEERDQDDEPLWLQLLGKIPIA